MFNSRGADTVDVHLILGAAGDVLREGIVAMTGHGPQQRGGELRVGYTAPGLLVEEVPCRAPEPPYVSVQTISFEVTAEYDLLRGADLFGLTTATDARRGHFPGISEQPLAVEQARQSVLARFSATVIRLGFDRPFGFLAVDRSSGLVLVAGWVEEPASHPDADHYQLSHDKSGAWGAPPGAFVLERRRE